MPLRTAFPNTNGQWVGAPGYPLVEIMSDGTGINVQSRPTGGLTISQLGEGGARAYEYQHQAYFFGEESAIALKNAMAINQNLSTVVTPDGTVKSDAFNLSQQQYADSINNQRAKDRAAEEATLSSGSFATDAPPPPKDTSDLGPPVVGPIVTTETVLRINSLSAPDASHTDPVTLNAPKAVLVTADGTPAGQVVDASRSPGASPFAVLAVVAIVGVLVWFFVFRRGGA